MRIKRAAAILNATDSHFIRKGIPGSLEIVEVNWCSLNTEFAF